MSRVAKKPIEIPHGIEVKIQENLLTVKNNKGTLHHILNSNVAVDQFEKQLMFGVRNNSNESRAHAGTTRALVNNMINGLNNGFQKKLLLVGVGYKAQVQGHLLNLTLGYSHPVQFTIPEGITVEVPTQTELIVKGIDKQKVGQVSATIRSFRAPEPYKGKGIRYSDETIILKEAKKK